MHLKHTVYVITGIVLLVTAVSPQQPDIIAVDVTVTGDTIKLHNLSFAVGTVSHHGNQGPYSIQLLNRSEQVLYQEPFAVSIRVSTGGHINDTHKYFRLPYIPAAETVRIQRNNTTIFQENLPQQLCSSDGQCPTYCAQRSVDPDCEAAIESRPDTGSTSDTDKLPLAWIAGIAGIVIAIGMVLYLSLVSES